MAITYNNLYLDVRQKLRSASIESATMEARELVSFACGKTREQLIQDGGLYTAPEMEQRTWELVERHLAGEPVAYLIGEWEFYGLPLEVSPAVLIPRPDTEVLVDQAIAYLQPQGECRVLDLCAGSGCIGLAVASQCPRTRGAIPGLDVSVRSYEPHLALDGGADGLDFYRSISAEWKECLAPSGRLYFEVGIHQAEQVAEIMRTQGFQDIRIVKDLNEIPRVVFGTLCKQSEPLE